jgi:type II secretory pathway component PulM
MKAKLGKIWKSRAPRERRMITGLTIILIITLYVSLVTSADRARVQLRSSMVTLRTQAAQFQQDISEHERLRVKPRAPVNSVDLKILMQTQADALGISRSLAGLETQGSDQVQVVLDSLPFADWLSLVAAMQMQQVRLDNGRVQALPAPGMVSVTATFIRNMPP